MDPDKMQSFSGNKITPEKSKVTPSSKKVTVTFRENRKFDLHIGRNE